MLTCKNIRTCHPRVGRNFTFLMTRLSTGINQSIAHFTPALVNTMDVEYDLKQRRFTVSGRIQSSEIRQYNPLAKLIVLFRDPFERALSNWQMEFARNWDTLDFSVAIRSEQARLRDLPRTANEWRIYSYIERGRYAEQVGRLLRYFPRDQLLFLRSQDLEQQYHNTLGRITSFLEISEFPVMEAKSLNCKPSIFEHFAADHRDLQYVRSLLRDDLVLFSTLTGLDILDWPTATGLLPKRS